MMDGDLPTHLDKLGDLLESGWCQGAFARSEGGRKVDHYSDRAVCFCIQGGIDNVGGKLGRDFRHLMGFALAQTLSLELKQELPNSITRDGCQTELVQWNDTPGRTKRDAVKLCRETAQRLRAAAA